MRRVIPVLFLLLIGISSLAHSAQPLDVLQGAIEKAIGILKDPRYQDVAQKESQHEKIWEVIKEVFDLREMSKRTLARNWKRFTPQQRKRFSDVFGEFLGNNYINKMQKDYKDEKVIYLSQEMVTDSKALVKTKILRENTEIPVYYSMQIRNGTWRVYDVNIEGVSLVKNYRAQVNKILFKKSLEQLIEQLKKKIEQQKTAKAVKD